MAYTDFKERERHVFISGSTRSVTVKELTVVEAIWETIIQVVAIVAELFCMDQEKLLSQILIDNQRLRAMRELAQTA
ncbi:MAG: hypothetical protein RRY07_00405 [Bacteroidaceae bacterium]